MKGSNKILQIKDFILIKYFLAIGMFLILDLYLKSSNLRKNNKYEFT